MARTLAFFYLAGATLSSHPSSCPTRRPRGGELAVSAVAYATGPPVLLGNVLPQLAIPCCFRSGRC